MRSPLAERPVPDGAQPGRGRATRSATTSPSRASRRPHGGALGVSGDGGTLAGVLYLAREDEPDRHRGVVVRLQDSIFAPPEEVLRLVRLDAPDIDVDAFRVAYLRYLRALWRHDPEAFLRLIERATGGADLTVTVDFGDAPHAPRRILGAALKQIAKTHRDEARRREEAGPV